MKDSINVVKGASKIARDNLIESALLEMPSWIDIQCMAKRIADRIVWRENND